MTTSPEALADLLGNSSRLLLQARLQPAQGSLFQPTGFPDIGAATFKAPAGGDAPAGATVDMLEVESPQSMANRLEHVCWDDARDAVVAELDGVPYVVADVTLADGEKRVASSMTEAHRLNSSYLLHERLANEDGSQSKTGRLESMIDAHTDGDWGDRRRLAAALLALDPNSLLHGIFFSQAKTKGTPRLTRVMSSFIEARGVRAAQSGGVKNDTIDPTGKQGTGAGEGYGNIPFSRTEYTADDITGFFSVDVALLRSYGLPDVGYQFLVTLALWKIARLLDGELRLRTRCDFDVTSVHATRPASFELPSVAELTTSLRTAIDACTAAGVFADPAVTRLTWTAAKRPAKSAAN